jgi:DNA (cytosine-5)-methyltransferase 1
VKVGELFSGIGGFGLGFEQSGFETLWQAEINPQCLELLGSKFHKAVQIPDVRGITSVWKRMRQGKKVKNYAKWKKIFKLIKSTDVLCGGFPCQDLSVAGARAGLDGERSGLWYTFRRIIAVFRPAWVVIENVPGLLSSNGGGDLAIVLAGLEKLGYRWAYRVLDAQYFGLAQRRERVFIVASLGDYRCAEVLFERESVCGDSAPSRQAGQNVAPTVAGCSNGGGANGPGRTADDAESLVPIAPQEVAPPCTSNPYGDHESREGLLVPLTAHSLRAQGQSSHREDSETFVMAHGQANAEVIRDGSPSLTCNHEAPIVAHAVSAGRDGYNDGSDQTYVTGYMSPRAIRNSDTSNEVGIKDGSVHDCLQSDGPGAVAIAFDTTQVTSRSNYSNPKPGDPCHPIAAGAHAPAVAFTERTRKDGRNLEVSEDVAYALTNPGSGGRTHSRQIQQSSAVRRLTPTECERLQGFPDGWTAGFSDSVRYRMLGNAVAVPVIKWIATRLKKAANET